MTYSKPAVTIIELAPLPKVGEIFGSPWNEVLLAWNNGEEHPALDRLAEEASIAAAESGADRELDHDSELFAEEHIRAALDNKLNDAMREHLRPFYLTAVHAGTAVEAQVRAQDFLYAMLPGTPIKAHASISFAPPGDLDLERKYPRLNVWTSVGGQDGPEAALPNMFRSRFCSEWDADPIALEQKIRVAESAGWTRWGLPYKVLNEGTGMPVGNYAQTLHKEE